MGGEIRLAGEGDAEPIQGIYAPIVRDLPRGRGSAGFTEARAAGRPQPRIA